MRSLKDNNEASAIPALSYILANIVFGLTMWFLNGIFVELRFVSETGDVYNFGLWMWDAIIIVFIIGSGFWLIRQYTKKAYRWG